MMGGPTAPQRADESQISPEPKGLTQHRMYKQPQVPGLGVMHSTHSVRGVTKFLVFNIVRRYHVTLHDGWAGSLPA